MIIIVNPVILVPLSLLLNLWFYCPIWFFVNPIILASQLMIVNLMILVSQLIVVIISVEVFMSENVILEVKLLNVTQWNVMALNNTSTKHDNKASKCISIKEFDLIDAWNDTTCMEPWDTALVHPPGKAWNYWTVF